MAGKRQNKSNGNIVFLKYTIIFYVIMIFIAESSINIIKLKKNLNMSILQESITILQK